MRKVLFAVAISFVTILSCIPTLAQDVTINTKLRNKYGGGNGADFYTGRVLQSDVLLKWKNGIYTDLWISTGFNTKWDFDKEFDWTLGKNWKFGEINYNVEVNYITAVVTDVMNINTELSHTFQPRDKLDVEPFVRAEWYFPVKEGGPRRGLMGVVGVRASAVVAPRLTIVAMDRFKKDTGCFGFNSTVLNQAELGV